MSTTTWHPVKSLDTNRSPIGVLHEGKVRHRHHEDQAEQALCLTVVTKAVVAWTAEYLGLAVADLRSGGRYIDDEVLAHVSLAHNENFGFYGTFSLEVASELAQLVDGYRPLRLGQAGAGPLDARRRSPRATNERRNTVQPAPSSVVKMSSPAPPGDHRR